MYGKIKVLTKIEKRENVTTNVRHEDGHSYTFYTCVRTITGSCISPNMTAYMKMTISLKKCSYQN